MKYKDKKQDIVSEFRFHDDEDPEVNKKRKMPSRISAYEVTKKSIVSKLAQVRIFNRSAITEFSFVIPGVWDTTSSSRPKLPCVASCSLR
jgi:hypothetical protein